MAEQNHDVLETAQQALSVVAESLHTLDDFLEPLDSKLAPFRAQATALHTEHERCAAAVKILDGIVAAIDNCNTAQSDLLALRRRGDVVGHAKRLRSLTAALETLSEYEETEGAGPAARYGSSLLESAVRSALSDVSDLASSIDVEAPQLKGVVAHLVEAGRGPEASASYGRARAERLRSEITAKESWTQCTKEKATSENPEPLLQLARDQFGALLARGAELWRRESKKAHIAFASTGEGATKEGLRASVLPSVKWVAGFAQGVAEVKGNVERVFAVLEARNHMDQLWETIESSLQACEEAHELMSEARRKLHQAERVWLEALQREAHSTSKSVRLDGMVDAETSRLGILLRRLIENEKCSLSDDEFGSAAAKCLETLAYALEEKAEALKDRALAEVFLMNNAAFLASLGRRSATLKRAMGDGWEEGLWKEAENRGERYLQEAWTRAKTAAEQGMVDPSLAVTTGKERERAKKAFQRFNQLLDEGVSAQSSWCVPERQLRDWLRQRAKEFVVGAYRRLYDHLGQVPFSRSPERFIRYTPEQVATKLDGLFSNSPV